MNRWLQLTPALLAALVAVPPPGNAGQDGPNNLDMPRYAEGDELTWRTDTSEWAETVTAIEGDLITWRASNGDVVTTSANFVLPPVDYDQEVYGTGGFELAEVEGTLFPLESGNWLNLRLRERGDDAEWTRFCHVGEWSEVDVPAGHFEVIEVSCQEVNRSKVWYYAPAVGTYVRYDNTHRIDGTVRQELVSYARAGG